MLYRSLTIAFCLAALPLCAGAHDLLAPDGKTRTHEHVFQQEGYGKNPRQGHTAQPEGAQRPITIYSGRSGQRYGSKAQSQKTIPRGNSQEPYQGEALLQEQMGTREKK